MTCKICNSTNFNDFGVCQRCCGHHLYDEVSTCNACVAKVPKEADWCWNCDYDPQGEYWDCPYCKRKTDIAESCECGLTRAHLDFFSERGASI